MLNVQMLETPCVCLYFGWVHGSIENKEVFLYFKFLLLIMRKSKKATRKPKFIFWFRLKVSKEITGNKNIAPSFSSPFSKVKKLNLLWQDTFFGLFWRRILGKETNVTRKFILAVFHCQEPNAHLFIVKFLTLMYLVQPGLSCIDKKRSQTTGFPL